MDLLEMKDLSMDDLEIIADIRGVKTEKMILKNEFSKYLKKYDRITYNESPFKSVILDIRSILPEKGYKKILKSLKYIEEIKKLTSSQIGNVKNELAKIRDGLVEKFKNNDRIKKADRDYYEYENNKFYGLKDIGNLFDENDDNIYKGIEYLFDESIIIYGMKQNGLEYEEIKKLVSIQPKEVIILHDIKQNGLEYEEIEKLMSIQWRKENCEFVSFISGRIGKEEVIECNFDYHEVNYEYEHVKKVYCMKQKPCLIDCEYIVCEATEDQNIEFCEIIRDQRVKKAVFC